MVYRPISGRGLAGRIIDGRALGRRISGGGRPGVVLLVPAAPLITWDGDEADSEPDFDVELPVSNGAPYDAEVGDVLRIQYSSNGGTNWFTYLTHTIVADDISGDPFMVSGVSSLPNDDYLFRARIERGSDVSSWSPSEEVIINAASTGLPHFTIVFN